MTIEIDYDRYRVEKVLRLFSKLKPANPLLDIGCYDGQITFLIKKVLNAENAYGIDVLGSALLRARDRGIQTILMDVDSSDFPFEDGYFQAVYCGEVIEHLNNPDTF